MTLDQPEVDDFTGRIVVCINQTHLFPNICGEHFIGEAKMTSATYGKRVGALLIDLLMSYGIGGVIFVLGIALAVSESTAGLGVFLFIVGPLVGLAIGIWNKVFKEGKTGQSVGKAQMGISLVDSSSGMPLGAGRCFLREFVFGLLNGITGSLFAVIDYLWPLWDQNNERVMDKIMTSRVIKTGITI